MTTTRGTKKCPRCRVIKPSAAFARRGRNRQWLQSWCKNCQVARKKQRYATDVSYKTRQDAMSARNARQKRDAGDLRYLAQRLLWEAKSRARREKVRFDLSIQDVLPHLAGYCPVFGTRFVTRADGRRRADPAAPSLDQLAPRQGYTRENVRVISWRANALKNNASVEEIAALLKWMRREFR